MRTAIKAALPTLLVSGGLLLLLGITIWLGDSEQPIAVHLTIGVVLVLTLWIIAAIAARSGVAPGTCALAASWGVVVVLVGLAQEELVPGSRHWTIQVLHVAISMGAIWWGRRLVRVIGKAQRSAGGLGAPTAPAAASAPASHLAPH